MPNHKMEWKRPLKPGTLVAVTGIDRNKIRRIARVQHDSGKGPITVQTDETLEGEAAIEYDFATPESEVMQVEFERLRPIIE
jgi:hypothetical protein